MTGKKLVTIAFDNKQYLLYVSKEANNIIDMKYKIIDLPNKLPMIVKPRPYKADTSGGYLLNDINYKEDIFISKKGYALNSEILANNKVYDMINHINSTPFKVNTALLDYLTTDKHKLLHQINEKHKFEEIDNKSRYQDNVYKAYISKVLLQEAILDIAQFYRKFDAIYFPVRLDQRGRIYCSPIYFNYQSNELARALILFSRPSFIHKSDLRSIDYLKIYGATCFGGSLTKQSHSLKLA